MRLRSIRNVKNLKGKTVIFRVGYDLPLKKVGSGWTVADDRRIKESLPTLDFLLKKKCKIVLMSWLGRPDGKVVDKLKMDPVAKALSKLIKKKVKKIDDCVGPKVFAEIQKLKAGELLMLENTRFYPEEMSDNKMFAALLAHGSDLICFDAFAHMHRVHASTTGIMRHLPSYSGFLMEKEIAELSKVINKPKRPLVVVMGGAKISDKIYVLQSLVEIADKVLIGGGLANVFLKANKIMIGKSYVEDVFVDSAKRKKVNTVSVAKKLLKKYRSKIVLPVDLLASNKISDHALTEIVTLNKKDRINKRWMFLDIGPHTIANYLVEIKKAKTVFFNGPMGVFELDKFDFGTKKIAQAIARSTGVTVIGGGDTEIVADKYKLGKKFSHISTGGGASMAFLSGKNLTVLNNLIKK